MKEKFYKLENYTIPECRLKHCYGVAWVMYNVAKNYYKWNEEKCREMFVLGYLHDVGYEFQKKTDNVDFHREIGANIMKNSGYKYFDEIYKHSVLINNKNYTEELVLLQFADSVVDGYGNIVGYEKRLEDAKRRHRDKPEVIKETEEIIKWLIKHYDRDKKQIIKMVCFFVPVFCIFIYLIYL